MPEFVQLEKNLAHRVQDSTLKVERQTTGSGRPDRFDTPIWNMVVPLQQTSAWTQSGDMWSASAKPIVWADGYSVTADSTREVTVYSPLNLTSGPGTASGTRFFAVWRGRWELVTGTPTPEVIVATVDNAAGITSSTQDIAADAWEIFGPSGAQWSAEVPAPTSIKNTKGLTLADDNTFLAVRNDADGTWHALMKWAVVTISPITAMQLSSNNLQVKTTKVFGSCC